MSEYPGTEIHGIAQTELALIEARKANAKLQEQLDTLTELHQAAVSRLIEAEQLVELRTNEVESLEKTEDELLKHIELLESDSQRLNKIVDIVTKKQFITDEVQDEINLLNSDANGLRLSSGMSWWATRNPNYILVDSGMNNTMAEIKDNKVYIEGRCVDRLIPEWE